MPELIAPTTAVHRSFLAAMEEFQREGRGGPGDRTSIGHEMTRHARDWDTPEGFAAFVAQLRAEGHEDTPRPNGIVPQTTLWYVDGAEYLGRVGIRHWLTAFLLEEGGHIGYDVRPSARRRGHATRMLQLALPVARDLGIDAALVTCDSDNEPSRRVIESAGGVFEDQRGNKLRYWVPTAPARQG